MTQTLTVETWHVACESTQWVGPITVTVTADGTPVLDAQVKFAVLPRGTRPTAADWADPFLEPGGGGALGVWLDPVNCYQRLGIWMQVTDSPEIPVLEPREVGWIVRT